MAIKDDKTPRLGLLLPFTDNFLQDDVERLRDTFDLLDVLVVTRDQTTGKIADDMLSAVIAKLDAQGKLLTAQIPSSVVQKGPDGKIDASLMPSIAVVDSFPVPDEASMLGLQCERGDIAIRTDLGRTFILSQMPPSVLGNWRELTTTAVSSVNGQTGAVTGLAKSGINNDITGLNALSGPLRLGGDAAGDYDAVTLKQLRAASGGAGGASMNGVMNNFIGAVEWFNGSRAKIPAGYVAADGQVLSRVVHADLYAAVAAGMLNGQPEATWINSADANRPWAWRVSYSQGGAAGTSPDSSTPDAWFRVPDLNGIQLSSIKHLFLAGSSGAQGEPSSGQVWAQSSPNIMGNLGAAGAQAVKLGVAPGSFGQFGTSVATPAVGSPVIETNPNGIDFYANRSSATYGRGTQYQKALGNVPATAGDPTNIGDLYPNHAVGIWIIRASGTFAAQNTEFQVQTSDTSAPANGTQVAGGKVTSIYSLPSGPEFKAQMWAEKIVGQTTAKAVFSVASIPNSKTRWMSIDTNGQIAGMTQLMLDDQSSDWGAVSVAARASSFNYSPISTRYNVRPSWVASNSYCGFVGGGAGATGGGWRAYVSFGALAYQTSASRHPTAAISISEDYDLTTGAAVKSRIFQFGGENNVPSLSFADDQGQGAMVVAWQSPSDKSLKDEITDYDGKQSLTNIEAMELKTFIYKADVQRRVRRGVIAQQVQEIDPEYVHENINTIGTMTLDSNVLLMDALAAIKVLSARVRQLEAAAK